ENLEASEKVMRSFIQNAPIGILAFNPQGKFNIGNEAAFKMFGFSENALMAGTLFDIAAPESSEIISDFMKKLHEKGSATADVLMKHKKNKDFWCAIYGVRLNEDLMVSFFVDITERVNAKNELEHEKSLLKGLLNSIPDVVFYKDLKGRYIGANPQFTKITGFSPDEYIGKTSNDLFDQSLASELNRFDEEVIKLNNEIVHTNMIVDSNENI
ncbi:PAS domain S-box protein, partial [Arthrospira platensis SPKY1]|nr:PAS domain S-box protein [Arthrospira platensis SPKY1]